MLTIRLQRTGKKNQAQFRVVLAEKEASVSKKFAEVLGSYNPHKKIFNISNPDRVNYWISQNVDISPTVHNLLVTQGILKAGKVKSFNIPKKKEEAKAEQASTEAAPQAETESASVAEAPTAEPEKAAEAAPETPAT